MKDGIEMENISLKYFTFLNSYVDNPVLAYSELKFLLSVRKTLSSYFEAVSTVLS